MLVLIDDLLVCGVGDTQEEAERNLLKNLRECFRRLRNIGMQVAPKKVCLYAKRMVWAGEDVMVGEKGAGIAIEQRRVKAALEMGQPKTMQELGQLTHVAMWCRGNILDFAQVMEPLARFQKKTWQAFAEKRAPKKKTKRNSREAATIQLKEYGWGEHEEEAFDGLRKAMADSIRLSFRDEEKKLILVTDASDEAYSYVWAQVDEDQLGKTLDRMDAQILCMHSAYFKSSEINWNMTDKEAYAPVRAVRDHPEYAHASKYRAYTDHLNLCAILSPKADIGKVAKGRRDRWAEDLRGTDYEIVHTPGENNPVADVLSRSAAIAYSKEDFIEGTASAWAVLRLGDDDGKIPDFARAVRARHAELRARRQARAVRLVGEEELVFGSEDIDMTALGGEPHVFAMDMGKFPTYRDIYNGQQQDKTEGYAKSKGLKLVVGGELDGVYVNGDGKAYVPDVERLRERIIIGAHQGAAIHRKKEMTKNAVSALFAWQGMAKDVKNFCHRCLHCVLNADRVKVPRATATTMLPEIANEAISFDYIYMGPSATGEKYILLLKDLLTQEVELVKCESANAHNAAKAVLDWCKRKGAPDYIVSDQGSHFVNWVVQDVLRILQIKHHLTTVYNPKSNGGIERANRELLKAMRRIIAEGEGNLKEWPDWTALVQYGLNTCGCASLSGATPIEVASGRQTRTPAMMAVKCGPDARREVKAGNSVKELSAALVQSELKVARQAVTAMQQEAHETKAARAERARLQRQRQRRGKPTGMGQISAPEDGNQKRWFSKGDYIMVATRSNQDRSSKLQPRWRGPYEITKMETDHRARVHECKLNPDKTPKEMGVASDRIKLWADKSYNIPVDVLRAAEYASDMFTIERLDGWRRTPGGVGFEVYVVWMGYEAADGSWLAVEDMFDTAIAVAILEQWLEEWDGEPIPKAMSDKIARLREEYESTDESESESE